MYGVLCLALFISSSLFFRDLGEVERTVIAFCNVIWCIAAEVSLYSQKLLRLPAFCPADNGLSRFTREFSHIVDMGNEFVIVCGSVGDAISQTFMFSSVDNFRAALSSPYSCWYVSWRKVTQDSGSLARLHARTPACKISILCASPLCKTGRFVKRLKMAV